MKTKIAKRSLLVDGNSVAWRAFHSGASLSYGGISTTMAYIFIRMLRAAMDVEEVDGCVVVWDYGKSKFRTATYPAYKANREQSEKRDEDYALFHEQQAWLSDELLPTLGIGISRCQGWEADDVLALWTRIRSNKNLHSVVMSGDNDLIQLLSPKVSILNSDGKSRTTVESLWDEWGITPKQWALAKTMCTDASDNIPGVPGVGLTTAVKIVKAGWDQAGWDKQPGITPRIVGLMTAHETTVKRNHSLMNLSEAGIMLEKELSTGQSRLEYRKGVLAEEEARMVMIHKGMAELVTYWTEFITPFRRLV